MNISVDIDLGSLAATMRHLGSALDSGKLHAAMGTEVQIATVNHLIILAGSRHKTANALGAAPTGHLAEAAEKVSSPSALAATSTEATLTINHPGLMRTFRDVVIRAVKSAALTIPIAAAAYGRRAGEFAGLFRLPGTNVLARKAGVDAIEPMFVLVRSVTQKQDRSLLPSDEEWSEAATTGARNFIRDALRAGGSLT